MPEPETDAGRARPPGLRVGKRSSLPTHPDHGEAQAQVVADSPSMQILGCTAWWTSTDDSQGGDPGSQHRFQSRMTWVPVPALWGVS